MLSKLSEDGKFKTTQLSDRVWIVEALGQDWFGWGNQEEDGDRQYPAFLAYFGCSSKEEALNYKKTIDLFYRADALIKQGKRTGWTFELKIRGLGRSTGWWAFGLTDLVEMSERADALISMGLSVA
jgi:hypothetical protein